MSEIGFRPATVLELSWDGGQLILHLVVGGGERLSVTIPVPDRGAAALPHIHALHGHSPHCGGGIDLHVGLLLRCCRMLGSPTPRLIVRATGAPAFWLQLQTAEASLAHIDIGVLDALVLLASRRVPLAVERPEPLGVERADPLAVERAEPLGVERAEPLGVERAEPRNLDAGEAGGAGSAGIDWDEALRRLLDD